MKTQEGGLLFCLHLPPPIHGSSVIGETIYNSQLLKKKYNCIFLNLLASSEVKNTGKLNISKIINFLNLWLTVLFQLCRKKPKLCYYALTSTGFAFYRDFLIVILFKIFRVQIVFHLHNKGIAQFRNNIPIKYLYNIVFKNSKVILLSEYLYHDISSFVSKENVYICPNGIAQVVNEKSKIEKDSEIIQILFLSNLIESKGVFILLEACSQLKRKGFNFHCTFIGDFGDITLQNFTEYLVKKDIVNEVSYVGKKYGIEKDSYFCNADIFALPTFYRNECFPLVLLEAMQYSLPIISTNEGGIRDIVIDGITGCICPQNNIEILTDKLIYLFENTNIRVNMGKEARSLFLNKYTLEHFEENLFNIIEKIIDK